MYRVQGTEYIVDYTADQQHRAPGDQGRLARLEVELIELHWNCPQLWEDRWLGATGSEISLQSVTQC